MVEGTTIINGVSLISHNDMVVRALKQRGSFEPDSLEIWNEIASKRGVMVDVGAYTGLYAISAAKYGSTSIALEPNPYAAKRLYLNASKNKLPVNIHNMAAWNCETTLNLYIKEGIPLTSAASVVTKGLKKFLVKAIPLDMLNLSDVKAIKVDAERSEKEIIEGALCTIEEYLPIMLIEELDYDMNGKIKDLISHLGYRSEKLSQSMTMWRV